jgi:hypothetical protein
LKPLQHQFVSVLSVATLLVASVMTVNAQIINWAGYTWNVTQSDRVGDGTVKGNLSNVLVDDSGDLHLKLSNANGVWTGAELGTSKNLGFGSYYWIFDAPLTTFEPQVVLGAFTYGPAAGIGKDASNEIDIEFSKWNVATNVNNGDFNIFPATGGTKGVNSSNLWNWTSGTVATCRIDWTPTSVTESVWSGVVDVNAPTSSAKVKWTYNGAASAIPQAAVPFLFNLWTYGSAPTQAMDVTVKNFQYIPAPSLPGAPSDLTAAPGPHLTTLNWTVGSGATSYNIYRGYSIGTVAATPVATGVAAASYTDYGLTTGNRYFYKVAAVNSAGVSGQSNVVVSVPK